MLYSPSLASPGNMQIILSLLIRNSAQLHVALSEAHLTLNLAARVAWRAMLVLAALVAGAGRPDWPAMHAPGSKCAVTLPFEQS